MRLQAYLVAAGLIMTGGCATSTSTPVREAKVAHTGDTPSSQALTPVISTADDPRQMQANRYAKEMGYKIETRHGVQYYCRVTAPIGSRLTEKQCLTVDGVYQAGQIAEQNKANFQQNQLCQGAGCVIK